MVLGTKILPVIINSTAFELHMQDVYQVQQKWSSASFSIKIIIPVVGISIMKIKHLSDPLYFYYYFTMWFPIR